MTNIDDTILEPNGFDFVTPRKGSRSNTVKVAAPLPRSAHHAVTLASLVGTNINDELDDLSEEEVAQAQEAYLYTRAVIAHMVDNSGPTPPPAPSSGKGLGAISHIQQSNALMWSPAFSNPSTSSFASSSRPRSSSTRNSFSSAALSSSYDVDRQSWKVRSSSISNTSSRKFDRLSQAMQFYTTEDGEERLAVPIRATSSLSIGSSKPPLSSRRSSFAPAAHSSTSGAMFRHRERSSTLPHISPLPTYTVLEHSASTFSSPMDSPRLLSDSPLRLPLPLPPQSFSRGKSRAKSVSNLSEYIRPANIDLSSSYQYQKRRLSKTRPPSWLTEPELPPNSRASKKLSTEDGTFEQTQRRKRPIPTPLLIGRYSLSESVSTGALNPTGQSTPFDEGELRMMTGLGLVTPSMEEAAALHRLANSGDQSKRHSLGNRRKSVDFALKAMGKLGKRKSSVGALSLMDNVNDTEHQVVASAASSPGQTQLQLGLLAKKSYAALVNALHQPLSQESSSSLPIVQSSGDQQQQQQGGGEAPSANGPSRGGGGMMRNGFNGSGSGQGWSGSGAGGGGGSSGGDGGGGGNGGRIPGGGGGSVNGRASPPISSVFRKLELAGRGAYGAVYRGVHVASGSIVALKVVNLDTPEDDVSDIQKEVALLSQLQETSSKNVVKYWGCWLKGSELWIVMDFAEGGSVRTLMKAGPIAEKYAVVIVRESLIALSYLHKSGIIHRDIKAANILLTTSGKVLLCDFGVAASLVSSSVHSKRSTFVGTPYWMAPEVITQGKTYDQSADIWSLGITIYEMVTGNPPLSDQEQMRAIMLIPKSKPPRLPQEGNFSTLLREFVSLCLNEEPKERPSADELAKTKWIKGSSKVPNSSLKDLIAAYAAWTKSGGMRMSLLGAEANDLNDANNRDSFAFDGIEMEDGWEFNTVNSRSMNWPLNQEQQEKQTSMAPIRDHPLLRLFQEGDEDEISIAPQPAPKSANIVGNIAKSANNVPQSTYMGADIRPAPLPPGPIPERPPIAPLTSNGVAVDKGSFMGMGATPFRFGGGGGGSERSAITPFPASPPYRNVEPQINSRRESDENLPGEVSLINSSYGFHHKGEASSSANTSFSTINRSKENLRDGEADASMMPPMPGFHSRNRSGLSAVSSSANEGSRGTDSDEQKRRRSRENSLSQYSHSRERSGSTSFSTSLASEKRNGTILTYPLQLPSTALPLHRGEGSMGGMREGEGNHRPSALSADAASRYQFAANQASGYPLQRLAQKGVRSRSGSRSRPMEAEQDWNSFAYPPVPNRSAVTAAAATIAIQDMLTPTTISNSTQIDDPIASALHTRRQHGGSDPTQFLARGSSREVSPELDKRQDSASLARWAGLPLPSGAPRLRALDFNTLVEKEDVHIELEKTIDDLGKWLDIVGTGLAQIAAKCI